MSIKEHITPESRANSILLDKSFKGSYLVVEGKTDYLFFSKFIEKENCRINIAFGNQNVIQILDILEKRNYTKAIGIIDADFRKILNKIPKNKNIILTETHDIETLIMESSIFEYVLESLSSNEKYNIFLSKINVSIKEYILELAKPIAILKLINETENLELRFKSLNIDGNTIKYNEFINKETFTFISLEKLIVAIKNYNQKPALSVEELKSKIEIYLKNSYNLYEICNGHDITNIISIGLQKKLGSINISADEIGKLLIMSYDFNYFKTTELYNNIISLLKSNQIINIFKNNLVLLYEV